MDRRDFLKLCSVAGLGVASSQLPGTIVDATAASSFDKFVVFVNAGGGWDHTLVGSPKGNVPNAEGWVVNEGFTPGEIGTAGKLIYAPVGVNAQFFGDFYQYMTVINGIDCETNGHDTGQINTWSGRLQQQTPCLAALIAAVHGGVKPLSFITNGGYDSTNGVPVAKTRLGGNPGQLFPLIYPNTIDTGNLDGIEDRATFHTADTFDRIMKARQERLDLMSQTQNLPRIKQSMNLLYTSRLGMAELKKIVDYLPDPVGQGMVAQANVALAAWAAGLCQTATMSTGGFDTHGPNTDQNQATRTTNLFDGVRALLTRASELNLLDKLLVVVGSEFGRTPRYNEQGGKDHWSVGELIIIDPSGTIAPGNRLIGDTDEFGRYKKINPSTLQVDDGAGAIGLKNSHVHKWLRKVTGIADHELVRLFPLHVAEDVDLSQPV
jgi:hypothetical protein